MLVHILVNVSIRAPTFGTRFQHLMIVATEAPKVGSTHHRIFNRVKTALILIKKNSEVT